MCPRLGGSAFSESGQRDLGVSSKAHKFACELRALLASDKHLGSAERSERQLPFKLNTPASARGTVADCYGFATAADPSRTSGVGRLSWKLGVSGAGRDQMTEARSLERVEVTNVSRIVVLGGSICCIL